MDPRLAALADLLLRTLEPAADVRRLATTALADSERSAGFAVSLLQLARYETFDLKVRLLAATHFKNIVKRNWNEPEPAVISAEDRGAIKQHLVDLMCSVPQLVQRQLSEALSIISRRDFPSAWPGLLGDLVSRLGAPDLNTVSGVLEAAASIFERFRTAPNTDPVRLEVRQCLDSFAAPLLVALASLVAQLEAATAERKGRAVLAPILNALRLVVSIFHSLAWLELPDVFEEKIVDWMAFLRKFLTYANPAADAASPDAEEGPVEALQAAVLDVVAMFADKYDEDFEAFFPTFAGDVWALLSTGGGGGGGGEVAASARIMSEGLDPLVTKAVRFLSASVGNAVHAPFFASADVQAALCERVILPNLRLRAVDAEAFEDNPIEFVRRDIEGSDSDTRRRVAADLARALCKAFEAAATPRLLALADALLARYDAAAPAARGAGSALALDKDAAVALIIAVAVKTATAAHGVTAVNAGVALSAYLAAHVLPELAGGADAGAPLVKAAALKFVTTFRAQFSREQLLALLPMVMPFAGARSEVVHTYAAAAVERVLTVRDRVQVSLHAVTSTPRLAVADIAPHLPVLFTGLFALMGRPAAAGAQTADNDYMMRALMRVVAFCGPAVAPYAAQVVGGLTGVLARVCANPTNPVFNHYLFETVACLMRNVAGGEAAAGAAAAAAGAGAGASVASFEALLFPPFQSVLANDVVEFLPYVFQLMAELLELRPAPPAGEHALTAAYQSLLPPLLAAEVWLRPGNVPALTMLMQGYLRRGAVYLASSGNLVPLLGVWQNLLATKNQEDHAFALLDALFEGAPLSLFSQYLGVIMQQLCNKLQSSKSAKIARAFTHSTCLFTGFHGVDAFEGALNALSPGLFMQIVESVLLTQAAGVAGREARMETAVGLTRIFAGVAPLLTSAAHAAATTRLLTVLVELLEPVGAATIVGGSTNINSFFDERDQGDLVEEAVASEYTAAFAQLIFAREKGRYAFRALVPDAKALLGAALAAAAPAALKPLVEASPAATTLKAYAAAAGAAL